MHLFFAVGFINDDHQNGDHRLQNQIQELQGNAKSLSRDDRLKALYKNTNDCQSRKGLMIDILALNPSILNLS